MLESRRNFIKGAAASLLPTPSLAFSHGFTIVPLQVAYVARSFGLFLHFNMSTFKDVEIASGSEPVDSFNPTALNIDQWVSTAQAAKVKYAVLTVKHHDGFCLWPTASTGDGTTPARHLGQTTWYTNNGNYNIAQQFVAKFKAAGIAAGIYFSVRDGSSALTFKTDATFKTYTQTQLTELAAYGPDFFWFDGTEPFFGSAYPWADASERFSFLRSLRRPPLLLVNNSKTSSLNDSNIIEFEQSGNPASGNTTPSELCEQMRTDLNWFWKSSGNAVQTASYILGQISLLNGRDCTYLLNAGPDNTGNIPSNMVTTLTTVGNSL